MTTNHFIALLKTFLLSFILGIGFTLLSTFLYYRSMADVGIDMVLGCFASFITSIMMCALWLPAATIIDKQKIAIMDVTGLFARHLPIVAIPFMITFVVLYFTEGLPMELMLVVMSIMFTAFTCLYVYFRILKSKGFTRPEYSNQNDENNSAHE